MRKMHLVGAFLVVGLVAGAVYGSWFAAEKRHEANLHKIRSLGYPITLEELGRVEPGSENALETYVRAADVYGQMSRAARSHQGQLSSYENLGYRMNWSAAEQPGFLVAYEDQFKDVLRELEKSRGQRAVWTERFQSQSANAASPVYIGSNSLPRVLAAMALASLQADQPEDAIARLELLAKFADDQHSAPFVEHYGAGSESEAQLAWVLAAALREFQDSPTLLAQLKAMLEARPDVPGPERSLHGEIAQALDPVQTPGGIEKFMASDIAKSLPAMSGLALRTGGARALGRQITADIAGIVEGLPKNDWRAHDRYVNEVFSKYDEGIGKSDRDAYLTHHRVWPAGASYAKSIALRRLGLVALNLLLDPSLKEDLGRLGEVAIDPFSGTHLKVKHGGDTLLLYSIGPDDKDDEAQHGPNSHIDLVFVVPNRD